MKKLFLIIGILISTNIVAQTTVSFNPFQALNSSEEQLLEDVYFQVRDNNNHYFNLLTTEEQSTLRYSKLLSLARNRANAIHQYYTESMGLAAESVKIQYGGTFPVVWLRKQNSVYTASGEITLSDQLKQCYTYKPSQGKTIYSDNGNTYIFPAFAFETLDGKTISAGDISICLSEFSDKKSLIYSNLTTHANDRMLETAGSFNIQASMDGKPVQLIDGVKYQVKMPTIQNHKDMFTYYGYQKEGIIDWEVNQAEPVQLVSANTSNKAIVEQMWVENEYGDEAMLDGAYYEGEQAFYELTAGKLGWINCDRFYDAKNTIALSIKVDTKEPVAVRVVFRDIESVMPCYASSNSKQVYMASGIPSGEKVLLLAYSLKDDKALVGYKEVVLGENKMETIAVEQTNKKGFERVVSELLY